MFEKRTSNDSIRVKANGYHDGLVGGPPKDTLDMAYVSSYASAEDERKRNDPNDMKDILVPEFLKGTSVKSPKELECEEWEDKYQKHFGKMFGIIPFAPGAPKTFDETIALIQECIQRDTPFNQPTNYKEDCDY